MKTVSFIFVLSDQHEVDCLIDAVDDKISADYVSYIKCEVHDSTPRELESYKNLLARKD